MKLYIDLSTRRFVRGQGGTSTALSRLTFKRRDVIALDIDFLQRGEVVPTPAGTTIDAALKSKFSDGEFFALADSNGTLDLYTQPVEDLFVGNTASVSALIEVKWNAPGEAMRTATLAVELQNSVILGDEGIPASVPDAKATLAEAEAGTSNEKWMTPLRVWDAIRKAAGTVVTWANLAGKPSTFPPDTHTHTAAQITDFATAVAAVAPGGVPAGAMIISKTYAELKTLKDANQLVPGQWYKITDFQLKWWNQSVNDNTVKTSAFVEPLNIFAISASKISTVAYSDLYPQDIVYYDFEATTSYKWGMLNPGSIPGIKGWIFRRVDTARDVDIAYDWRHITVNCCRPDISQVPNWSSATLYSKYSVVQVNNKLFISVADNNSANPTQNAFVWEPVSNYNEGLTYFPTDESFCLTIAKPVSGYGADFNNYNNYFNTANPYILNLPALASSRVQKYTFNDSAESVGNRSFHSAGVTLGVESHSNLFCGYVGLMKLGDKAQYNIFLENCSNIFAKNEFQRNVVGFAVQQNSFGSYVFGNFFSDQFFQNNFGDFIRFNKFSRSQSGNYFGSIIVGNIFCGGMNNNRFGSTILANLISPIFSYNDFATGLTGNEFFPYTIGNVSQGVFQDNKFAESVNNSIFGNGFIKNNAKKIDSCTFGVSCVQNVFPSVFAYNNVGNFFSYNNFSQNTGLECYWNSIGHNFESNAIGTGFQFNKVEILMRGVVIGNNFKRNTIGSMLFNYNGTNFSTASHVYNDYDCTIIKASSGQPRLNYYNAADQLIVTSPTA